MFELRCISKRNNKLFLVYLLGFVKPITVARALLSNWIHSLETGLVSLTKRAVQIVLSTCRALVTGAGTLLSSSHLVPISRITPVTRNNTVGKIDTVPTNVTNVVISESQLYLLVTYSMYFI